MWDGPRRVSLGPDIGLGGEEEKAGKLRKETYSFYLGCDMTTDRTSSRYRHEAEKKKSPWSAEEKSALLPATYVTFCSLFVVKHDLG